MPLRTTDRQIAWKKLREIVQEEQEERAGFIRPKKEREAMQRPFLEHVENFIAERYAIGRDEPLEKRLAYSISERLAQRGSTTAPTTRQPMEQ